MNIITQYLQHFGRIVLAHLWGIACAAPYLAFGLLASVVPVSLTGTLWSVQPDPSLRQVWLGQALPCLGITVVAVPMILLAVIKIAWRTYRESTARLRV